MRELQATTAAGADLVQRAERFAARFADAAADHDRDGSYAHDHVAALRDDGFLYAPLPVECGGLGVESTHDILVAASRLARGDAATTIGVNMHFAVLANLRRRVRIARHLGHGLRVEAITARMSRLAHSGAVLVSAVSERDQDLQRPATRAVRGAHGGWLLDGHKWFATMAPAATAFSVAVTYCDDQGDERYAFALVPADAAGVVIHDDWDGLGMRASGSHSVSFHDVALPPGALRDGFPVDRASAELLDRFLSSGAFHAAAALGIAEAAHDHAVAGIRKRPEAADEAYVRMQVAASSVDLAAIRASFDRAAHVVDEAEAADPAGDATVEEWSAWFAEVQAAKAAIAEGSQRVVDRALALSGGAGYRTGHPLARAYRDVRALPFMHPLGANRAYRFIAEAELGEVPSLR